MKIFTVIDCLNSGGAQRQLVNLVILLSKRGHQVTLLTYRERDFFKSDLDGHAVRYVNVSGSKYLRFFRFRKLLRKGKPDAVIAFLKAPVLMTELASLPRRDFGLIVSERSGINHKLTTKEKWHYQLHRIADRVVANSNDLVQKMLCVAPYLASKTKVIYNSVPLDHFQPRSPPLPEDRKVVKLLVLGRFAREKNSLGLLKAVEHLNEMRPGNPLVIDWYGNNFFVDGVPTPWRSDPFIQLRARIQGSQLQTQFRLHAPHPDPITLYQDANAVCMPSFFEGCSNVICEAMACGLPVLASNVCENPTLVQDGGFFFDPKDPRDIASALAAFLDLTPEQRLEMGKRNRARAENLFDPDAFADQYENLIGEVAKRS